MLFAIHDFDFSYSFSDIVLAFSSVLLLEWEGGMTTSFFVVDKCTNKFQQSADFKNAKSCGIKMLSLFFFTLYLIRHRVLFARSAFLCHCRPISIKLMRPTIDFLSRVFSFLFTVEKQKKGEHWTFFLRSFKSCRTWSFIISLIHCCCFASSHPRIRQKYRFVKGLLLSHLVAVERRNEKLLRWKGCE